MNEFLQKQTALEFQKQARAHLEKKAEDLLKTIKKRKDLPSYSAMRAIELRDKIFAAETKRQADDALNQLRELAEISKANNSNNHTTKQQGV